MKRQNFQKGKRGEEIAEKYLRDLGLTTLEKNYSTKFGEIDIIMENNDSIHFVEVKLKVGERFGTPEEMISKNKLRQVQRIAELYMLKNKSLSYDSIFIDAVCIVIDDKEEIKRLDYYQNLTMDL